MPQNSNSPHTKGSKRAWAGWFVAGALLLTLGGLVVYSVITRDTEDALSRWQDRVSIIADSRASEASGWLNMAAAPLSQLSSDSSFQFYVSSVLAGDDAVAEAQRGYIYSLLAATAQRTGYHTSSALDDVPANVDSNAQSGLAFVRGDGTVLVATRGFPPEAASALTHLPSQPHVQLGPQLAGGQPTFLVSVPMQISEGSVGDGAPSTPAAWVVGVRPIGPAFLKTLEQPGLLSRTGETFLLAPANADSAPDNDTPASTPVNTQQPWQVASPLAKGGRLGELMRDPATHTATERPGAIITDTGYAGAQVISTARSLKVPGNWLIVHQIDAAEALADVTARRNTLLVNLTLGGLVILGGFFIAWRTGTSRRLRRAYDTQLALSKENSALYGFFQLLSDSQPSAVAALDEDGRVIFANKEMAALTHHAGASLTGQPLVSAFSADTADQIKRGLRKSHKSVHGFEDLISLNISSSPSTQDMGAVDAAKTDTGKTNTGSPDSPAPTSERFLRAQYTPATLPHPLGTARTLVVIEDITTLLNAERETEDLLRQLVTTLTRIIDARDPWSRYHAERVAEVAATTARAMGLDGHTQDTVHIAGQLVNLGKVFVPAAILTKTTPLSDDELALVRTNLTRGAQMVQDLKFRGPVGASIAQMQENWNGSGEMHLKGTDTLLEARILKVANAFVGMVSARAHRSGLSFDAALASLNELAGELYDRSVVAALANVVENQNGRTNWMYFTQPPENDL